MNPIYVIVSLCWGGRWFSPCTQRFDTSDNGKTPPLILIGGQFPHEKNFSHLSMLIYMNWFLSLPAVCRSGIAVFNCLVDTSLEVISISNYAVWLNQRLKQHFIWKVYCIISMFLVSACHPLKDYESTTCRWCFLCASITSDDNIYGNCSFSNVPKNDRLLRFFFLSFAFPTLKLFPFYFICTRCPFCFTFRKARCAVEYTLLFVVDLYFFN